MSIFIVVSVSVSFVTLGTGLKHVLDGFVFSSDSGSSARSGGGGGGGGSSTNNCRNSRKTTTNNTSAFSFVSSPTQCCAKLILNSDRTNATLDDPSLQSCFRSSCFCCCCCHHDGLRCISSVLSYTVVLYLCGFGLILFVSLINPEGFLIIIEIFGSLALNVECGVFVALMAYESNTNQHYSKRYIPLSLGSATVRRLCGFTVGMFALAVVYDVLTAGVKYVGWGGWLGILVGVACVVGGCVGAWSKGWCRRRSGRSVVMDGAESPSV